MSERIVAVDRALEILELLHKERRPVGVSEISRELGLNKSTVHRCLASLEYKGFVRQDYETGRYSLGMKLLAMGLGLKEELNVVELISNHTKYLHEQTGEAVNVSVLEESPEKGYLTIMVHKEWSRNSVLTANPDLGSSVEAYTSSVGKCLLAFNPNYDEKIMEANGFTKYTPNTISSIEEFRRELEEVRKNGYAIDNQELEIGLFCIGVPIFNGKGEVIAGISISGPVSRIKEGNLEDKVKLLKEVSKAISEDIGDLKITK
ncbi:MAG: IclR family transcriptional regulator [Tissierellia bacterium]|nr:IclR family transcriptional regulator [Tissierellia bacterium]